MYRETDLGGGVALLAHVTAPQVGHGTKGRGCPYGNGLSPSCRGTVQLSMVWLPGATSRRGDPDLADRTHAEADDPRPRTTGRRRGDPVDTRRTSWHAQVTDARIAIPDSGVT
ncbi:hypothetical protein GTS_09000 [Gandjariella thermophila]|uniref:Uncharacterized protein n=1 Tax=Gandjariella thermophila TaxID=1931992 RepID=A0A4D4J5K5_9PSEU|nr:hypothetical protein GTS_09000 [Gandjariella thermophila]